MSKMSRDGAGLARARPVMAQALSKYSSERSLPYSAQITKTPMSIVTNPEYSRPP
jgi:hypothetical protein